MSLKSDNPLGDYLPQKKIKTSRRRRKVISNGINTIDVPLEIEEQKTLVEYCKVMGFLSWATPNGGKRGKTAQINAKKEGVLAGVSDYIVMLPNKILFIEMKRRPKKLKSGKLSISHTETTKEQLDFIDKANKYSYAEAKLCYGAEEAINFIKQALKD